MQPGTLDLSALHVATSASQNLISRQEHMSSCQAHKNAYCNGMQVHDVEPVSPHALAPAAISRFTQSASSECVSI